MSLTISIHTQEADVYAPEVCSSLHPYGTIDISEQTLQVRAKRADFYSSGAISFCIDPSTISPDSDQVGDISGAELNYLSEIDEWRLQLYFLVETRKGNYSYPVPGYTTLVVQVITEIPQLPFFD